MSDLLIKNIELPKNCLHCFIASGCKLWADVDMKKERHKDCPLMALPDHGDFIQRDDFLDCLQQIMVEVRRMATEEQGKVATIFYDTVVEMVKLCPVVLPKSGS